MTSPCRHRRVQIERRLRGEIGNWIERENDVVQDLKTNPELGGKPDPARSLLPFQERMFRDLTNANQDAEFRDVLVRAWRQFAPRPARRNRHREAPDSLRSKTDALTIMP